MAIRLERPNEQLLPAYVDALRTGWSPHNEFDVCALHLAQIEADPAAFLASFDWAPGQTIEHTPGVFVPRLPGHTLWISDGEFCGRMNLRWPLDETGFPPHISGHIGYAVVPWKRRRGIATAALRLIRPYARAAGLDELLITTNPANLPSQGVILAAGGRFDHIRPNGTTLGFILSTKDAA